MFVEYKEFYLPSPVLLKIYEALENLRDDGDEEAEDVLKFYLKQAKNRIYSSPTGYIYVDMDDVAVDVIKRALHVMYSKTQDFSWYLTLLTLIESEMEGEDDEDFGDMEEGL